MVIAATVKIVQYVGPFATEVSLQNPDYDFPYVTDLLPAVLLIPVFHAMRKSFAMLCPAISQRLLPEKYTGDYRAQKILKFNECAFKFCFFFTSSLFGYYALKDTDFLSAPFGGNGDLKNMV